MTFQQAFKVSYPLLDYKNKFLNGFVPLVLHYSHIILNFMFSIKFVAFFLLDYAYF